MRSFNIKLEILIFLFMFALGFFLLEGYIFQVNPDGICYISIAEKYMRGDFFDAINGYWGPLFSWLLAPLLILGFPSFTAVKILSLFSACIALIGINSLSKQLDISRPLRRILLVSSIPILLFYAYSVTTPDLLLLTVLIFYLKFIFSKDYANHPWYGIVCGVLGGLAYLTKAFAFPFFVVHFFVFNILHYFRSHDLHEHRSIILRNAIFGFVCFFVISGAWIFALHHKYNKWTISTAGSYNHGLKSPESKGHPMHYQGFLKPSNKTALSAWEDPFYLVMEEWNPLKSGKDLKHQIGVIRENLGRFLGVFLEFSIFSIAILILYIWLYIPFDRRSFFSIEWYPLMTLLIYAGGYSLLGVLPRFLWICQVLFLLMGVQILTKVFSNNVFPRAKKVLLVIVLVLSFSYIPANNLMANRGIGKKLYHLSQVFQHLNIRGNIASNREWHITLYLCYYLNAPYYGELGRPVTAEELKTDLEKFDIDYYFVWGPDSKEVINFLSNYREVTKQKIGGLKVYSLKKLETVPILVES